MPTAPPLSSRVRLLSVVALTLAGCPAAPPDDGLPPSPVTDEEHAATIASLRRSTHARPLLAIVASRSGSETTDLLVPFGVLSRSGLVEVIVVAETLEPLALMPALRVRPQQTFAAFTAAHPEGADYLIVPAMMSPDDPVAGAFLRQEHERGATIVGICSGARVLAANGLLDGRRATAHWADLVDLMDAHPTMTWVRDRRYVVDREVMTTTGVSASLPASLALVEALAGEEVARRTAAPLGVSRWRADHDSDAFRLTAAQAWAAATNSLPSWNKERHALPGDDGFDEVGVALAADAWSRTFRSRGALVTPDGRDLRSLGGLVVESERGPADQADVATGVPALERALADVEERYGADTASFVAVQLEFPR